MKKQGPDINRLDFKNPIYAKDAKANVYGLDLSDEPDYIRFTKENIEIELVGGITDTVLSSLRVSFKMQRIGESSAMNIYRVQLVDLFNDHNVSYVLRAGSERLGIDMNRLKPILYDFIERIDRYRRNECKREVAQNHAPRMPGKELLQVLQSKTLLDDIEALFEERGFVDSRLAMKLFLIGLTRLTDTSYHSVMIGDKVLCHDILDQYQIFIPEEHLLAVTTISKQALSHPPYKHYWDHRLLLLHEFSGSVSKTSTLLEYMKYGHSRRIITENHKQTGVFTSSDKLVQSCFSVLTYTDEDMHPVYYSPYVFCLQLEETEKLKNKLFREQIRKQSGFVDTNRHAEIESLIRQIQLCLKPYEVKLSCTQELDLTKVFSSDYQKLSQFLVLIKVVALLKQKSRGISGTGTHPFVEATCEDILYVMQLFEDYFITKDETLSWNVQKTWEVIRLFVKEDGQLFSVRDILKRVSVSPGSLARHIKTLESYCKIERRAGNNKTGFKYAVIDFGATESNAEEYQKILTSLSQASHQRNSAKMGGTEVFRET